MSSHSKINEGVSKTFASAILLPLYGRLRDHRSRAFIRRLIVKLEEGPVYSRTIRCVYKRFHDLDVGLYTIGPCEGKPGNFARGTRIGRYSSVYYTVRVLSDSDIFPQQMYPRGPLLEPERMESPSPGVQIGNDVFIGHNAIILPSVRIIANGAFIGAGSVVQSDIPPYAVVTGNPARVVRYRFAAPIIKELLESQWWIKSISELSTELGSFGVPLAEQVVVAK